MEVGTEGDLKSRVTDLEISKLGLKIVASVQAAQDRIR